MTVATALPSPDLLSPAWFHVSHAVIQRGEGAYLYDVDGHRYLDFTCGIGVTNTGHCHPRVVAAIRSQAEHLLFGQMNCVMPQMALELAATLRTITPESLDCFFFSNSGSEAVEAAVKLAKNVTRRGGIIAFQGSFHGRTHLAMALTASKSIYRANYNPLPSGIFFAPFPYAFRYGWTQDQAVDFCLNELKLVLKSQTSPCETAAIMVEPVLGEGGYVPAPPRFLHGLREICDENKMLLIFDEIQSGFGRTGAWWAHQHSGVTPDILIMAKGMGSGMPISAIAAPRRFMEQWPAGSHGGTYGGGNAVVMAAAKATVEAMQEEGLVDNAREMGEYLTGRLRELQVQFPVIGDVRGPGLMIATEFSKNGKPAPELTAAVAKRCVNNRLLLLTCGTYGTTIRWIPPLIVTRAQIDDALAIFTDALRAEVG